MTMTLSQLVLIVSLVLGAFLATLAARIEQLLANRGRRRTQQKETIQERITRLTNSLTSAADLIGQIEREIEERSKLAAKLQSDVETYNEIAALKRQEVEAVAQVIRGEVKAESRRSFWVNLGINLSFFVLGIVATVIVAVVMSPAH